MKKIILSFIVLLLVTLGFSAYANSMDEYTIYSKIYDVLHDKKNKRFIISEYKDEGAVNIVFDKKGNLLEYGNKKIYYKNGRLSRFGNDYISYLNGKLYTIGGKKVEFDSSNSYVVKIGDMSVKKYFTDEEYTYLQINNKFPSGGTALMFLRADGVDFSSVFYDVFIPFDDTVVYEDKKETTTSSSSYEYNNTSSENKSKKSFDEYLQRVAREQKQIRKIGDKNVTYQQGKIYKIGDKHVTYEQDRIRKIGDKNVTYQQGKIYKIGDERVTYEQDRIRKIGDKYVTYEQGRIYKIGDKRVEY